MKGSVDNVCLHSRNKECLFQYLEIILYVYVNYWITINLQKTSFFIELAAFGGNDIDPRSGSYRTASAKVVVFYKLLNIAPNRIKDT